MPTQAQSWPLWSLHSRREKADKQANKLIVAGDKYSGNK